MIDPLKLRDPYDSIEFRSYQKCPQCIMCQRNDKIKKDAVWVCDDCRGECCAGALPCRPTARLLISPCWCHATGKPFCASCDRKHHAKRKFQGHIRKKIALGKPVKRQTDILGDGCTFPQTHDWVEIKYQCKRDDGKLLDSTKMLGRTVRYQAGTGGPCCHVQILGCDGLMAADLLGFSDPYVAVMWNEKLVGCTQIRMMTLNPRWDSETYVVPLGEEFVQSLLKHDKHGLTDEDANIPALKLEVFDYDAFGGNDFLGQVALSPNQILRRMVDDWEFSEEMVARGEMRAVRERDYHLHHKHASGKVGLAIHTVTHPDDSRKSLFIRIVNARHLERADAFSLSDPYAKLFWNDKFVGRTKHIDDTLDPEWELKTSTFEIPLLDEDGDELNPPISESTARVEVFDHDMIGSDDSLGYLNLDSHDLMVLEQKSRPSELELLQREEKKAKKAKKAERAKKMEEIKKKREVKRLRREKAERKLRSQDDSDEEEGGASSSAPEKESDIEEEDIEQKDGEGAEAEEGEGREAAPHPWVEGRGYSLNILVAEARDLIAADKGGTSDPYAVLELVDVNSGNLAMSAGGKRTHKTKTIKKTLAPEWQEQVTWEGLTQDPKQLGVRVKVFDADMLSKEALGEVTKEQLPVAMFPTDYPALDDWYDLKLTGNMKEVSGALHLEIRLEFDDAPKMDEEDEEGNEDGERKEESSSAAASGPSKWSKLKGAVALGVGTIAAQEGDAEDEEEDDWPYWNEDESDDDELEFEHDMKKKSCFSCNPFKCCFGSAKVSEFDLSEGMGDYGDRVLRHEFHLVEDEDNPKKKIKVPNPKFRDISKFKSFYPLHLTPEQTGEGNAQGSMTLRLIFNMRGVVLRGLDQGVQRMSLGETATLSIRSDYAFGEVNGALPIPPDTRLKFVVQLLKINGKGTFRMRLRRYVFTVIYQFAWTLDSIGLLFERFVCPCPPCCICFKTGMKDPRKTYASGVDVQDEISSDEEYVESSEDDEPLLKEKHTDLMDIDEDETEEERLAREHLATQGARSMFGGKSKAENVRDAFVKGHEGDDDDANDSLVEEEDAGEDGDDEGGENDEDEGDGDGEED